MKPTGRPPRPVGERFAAFVGPPDAKGCRLWLGRLANGYGRIQVNGRATKAHRVALELSGVPVPRDAIVCHRCDNRRCVNPAHLYVGTHKDNANDRETRGRGIRGDTHHKSKLTRKTVAAMRVRHALGENFSQLGREYGVSSVAARNAIIGKTWTA